MRTLFRSNSFGSRLLAGSAQFYLSIICFLMVLLAFSLMHSFRLSTQLERVHWQLALSQMLRSTVSPGYVQGEDARQLEHAWVKDAESQLKLLQENLEKLIKAQTPDAFSGASCPGLNVEETDDMGVSFVRAFVGMALLMTIGGGIYILQNVDRLKDLTPNLIVKFSGEDNHRPLSHVVAYRTDRWFSTNKHAKVMALLFFTVLLVIVGSLGLFAVSDVSLYEAMWGSLAGVGIDWTFSQDYNPKNGIYSIIGRLVSMVISLGGLLITALLLGIVSEIISDKVDEMKKGTSDVLESNHTLVLGWSDEMIPILRQICLANESIDGSAIVILAEREKEEMEADIRKNSIQLKGSEIICRSGNPLLKHDLDKVSVHSARSIIVLANQQSPDQSDARVLRIILSLVAFHEEGGLQVGYVVAELCDMDNEPLVKLVGGDLVQTVVSHDIIGRLMIQCAMQPGLAAVYDELMGFEGCEFYFQHWPELNGKKFEEALLSFPDAVPIGIKEWCSGDIKMNIDDDYVLQDGDELLVVAEDEDTYRPRPPPLIKPGMCPSASPPRATEKILFLGWRRDMDDMIVVLDQFVTKGSELWLYNEVPIKQREQMLIQGGLNPDVDLKNLTLRFKEEGLEGDLITRRKLEALNPASFSSILVLADESANGDDIADADSRNLATLLLLRDIMRSPTHGRLISSSRVSMDHLKALSMDHSETVIVSEILDARTRHLIMQLNISEFVMSNEIVSMALAMVAESADVNHVLQELFSEEGAEFYLRPAEKYIGADEQLCFFELMARCRQRKEIAIGFKRRRVRDTIINPPNKNENCLDLKSVDSIIVLAD